MEYQCSECGKCFNSLSEVIVHKKRVHTLQKLEKQEESSTVKSDDQKARFGCNYCDKIYTCKVNLNKHINTIHNGKISSYKCSECERIFSTNSGLYSHVKSFHCDTEEHFCTLCNFKTKTKGCLRVHIETVHDKVKV